MRMARESLKDKWGLAIGTFLLFFLLSGAPQMVPFLGQVGTLILAGPFMLGAAIFSLTISRNREAKLNQIFEGFNNFTNAMGAYLLMVLYVLLWTLLFVIPGIVASLSYSMIFFIMADDSTIGPTDALKKSKAMMYGYKIKLFGLTLRFLGLAFLCILTLGIGFLWLIPYINVTTAKFYDDLKMNYQPNIAL